MLKLMGAALLVGGGLLWGLGAAGELSRRVQDLERWMAALGLLEGELAFSLPAMPTLLEGLSRRCQEPPARVFQRAGEALDSLGERPFAELWSAALREEPGTLTEGDLEVLDRLGAALGRYGWEEQCRAAEAARQALGERLSEAREDRDRKGRTCGALGVSLGAFLTILLL